MSVEKEAWFQLISKKQLMWHGTSSDNLKSIMRKGLLSDPKKKHFQPPSNRLDFSMESHGGLYLSTDISYAGGAAFWLSVTRRSNQLLVGVELETQGEKVMLDEDALTESLQGSLDLGRSLDSVGKLWEAAGIQEPKSFREIERWASQLDLKEAHQKFLLLMRRHTVGNPGMQEALQDPSLLPVIDKTLRALLLYYSSGLWGYRKQLKTRETKTLKAYVSAANDLSKALKALADEQRNLRVSEGIGFEGEDRIVFIVEFTKHVKEYTVHYNKSPQALAAFEAYAKEMRQMA